VMKAVWGFGLIYYVIYDWSPGQFQVVGEPTLATFLLAAASGLYFSEPGAIATTEAVSQSAALLNGLTGVAILGVGVVGIYQTVKARKDHELGLHAVGVLRRNAIAFEADFKSEYGVTFDEALLRLGEYASSGLATWASWLLEQVPPDYWPTGESDSREAAE